MPFRPRVVAVIVRVATLSPHSPRLEGGERPPPRGDTRAGHFLWVLEAMRAIRLRSIRSLSDTGFVELRPLTILVGRNSSGKSTFLRILPLLRQSVEARTTGPIQWYGDYVDFGGFEETPYH